MDAWIREQIAAHSVAANPVEAANGDATVATRLADAAGGLCVGSQAFGMQLRANAELAASCAAPLAEWLSVVRDRAAFVRLLERHGLSIAAPSPRPGASHVLHVFVEARCEDIETDELVTDPNVLAQFVGVRPTGDTSLTEIPCLRAVTRGWAIDGHAELVEGLRFRLTFELTRAPFPPELTALFQVIDEVLFFTGWGLNLELYAEAAPDNFMVHTGTNVVGHDVLPVV